MFEFFQFITVLDDVSKSASEARVVALVSKGAAPPGVIALVT
jgi:hypothetical protein